MKQFQCSSEALNLVKLFTQYVHIWKFDCTRLLVVRLQLPRECLLSERYLVETFLSLFPHFVFPFSPPPPPPLLPNESIQQDVSHFRCVSVCVREREKREGRRRDGGSWRACCRCLEEEWMEAEEGEVENVGSYLSPHIFSNSILLLGFLLRDLAT